METPKVITKQWIAETFSWGSIQYNNYYKAFLVTFETERYHNGSMVGGSLAKQLERMDETLRACTSFDLMFFASEESAKEFCKSCGVTPYVGKVIYHVDGSYRIE